MHNLRNYFNKKSPLFCEAEIKNEVRQVAEKSPKKESCEAASI
jgi:hypothetical protein